MDFQAFQGLLQAVEMKSTLQQIDDRVAGRFSTGSGNGATPSLDSLVPVLDQYGNKFAQHLLGSSNLTLAIPKNLATGTLVNYENEGQRVSGMVAYKSAGPFIQVLTPDEAAQYQIKNPNAPVYQISGQYYDSVFVSKNTTPSQLYLKIIYYIAQNLPLIILFLVIIVLIFLMLLFS